MGIFNDIATRYNYAPQAAPVNNNNNYSGQATPRINTPQLGTSLQYNPNQYSASDNKNALSYKTNVEGKDYFYSPMSTSLGGGAAYNWDPNRVKELGGVSFNRALPGATANPNNSNPYSQAQNPTSEQGYLFENDPNALQNMGYNEWKDSSWWQDQGLGLAAIAAAPFAVSAGLGAAGSGGATPISGGGAMATSSAAPGGAMMGGGTASAPAAAGAGITAPTVNVAGSAGGFTGGSLGSAGYIPSSTGLSMTGGGLGLQAPAAGAASLGTGSTGGLSGLSNLFGGGGVLGTGLSGGQSLGLGLGLTDMAMRFKQQQELQDIAGKASQMANPLNDPQRQQYQQLLSQYMNGGMDITQQPIIKSEMDAMKRAAEAQMAKAGMTGSGNVGNVMSDYMLEAMNRTSQPYLNFLAGAGGFNGQGNGANIYATMAGQATGAPFQGMNSLGSALNNLTYNQAPWWSSAYNAQQQMMGRGSNSNFYGIA